jgi:hypothetical protein
MKLEFTCEEIWDHWDEIVERLPETVNSPEDGIWHCIKVIDQVLAMYLQENADGTLKLVESEVKSTDTPTSSGRGYIKTKEA